MKTLFEFFSNKSQMDSDISNLKLATDNQIERLKEPDSKPHVKNNAMQASRSQALSYRLRRNIEKIGRSVSFNFTLLGT